MPNQTASLGFNVFLENDTVNYEDINDNFEKLDDMNLCIESGTITAAYSGGTDAVATWHYRKYADGTVDMSTKLNFTNLKCNGGDAAPYYSGDVQVYFPFSFSEVYDVQMHMASNTRGWVANTTGASVLDRVRFIVLGMWLETDFVYKQVFVNVKGVLA